MVHEKSIVETEKKYLLDAEHTSMTGLRDRVTALFPDAELVGAFYETSHYYPSGNTETLAKMGGLGIKLAKEGITQLDGASIRTKHRRNHWGHDRALVVKSALHGTTRNEREIDISASDEEFLEKRLQPETTWESHRMKFLLQEGAIVDIQQVAGPGFTMEIEAKDEITVDAIGTQLGLVPVSGLVQDAIYEQYKMRFGGTAPEHTDHFTSDDWRAIAETAGEDPVFNRL